MTRVGYHYMCWQRQRERRRHMRMADTALRFSGGAPDDAGVKKLIEYWKGVQFRREDGTWTQLSLRSAEEWAQIDARRMRQLAEVQEHVADSYREYLRTLATLGERQIHGFAPEISRQEAVLDSLSAILPRRVLNEDQGDYIERIRERIGTGQPGRAWACVCNAVFWSSVNAIGYWRRTTRVTR